MHKLQLATPTHQRAYDFVQDLLLKEESVLALAITGSASRDEGSFDSDLDFNVFFAEEIPVAERNEIVTRVESAFNREIYDQKSAEVGRFFDVELHVAPTLFTPRRRGWTDGPDDFELEIGNTFVYTRLIFERDGYFTQAQANYLPYYAETLRQERLAATLKFCTNNLEHIEPFVRRGLYFQAFRRLYDATREFLQALFITRRLYPIAYDKWVRKQIVEILDLPDLYPRFVELYEVHQLESDELTRKGQQLESYIKTYIEPHR